MSKADVSKKSVKSADAKDRDPLAPKLLGVYGLDGVVAELAQTFRIATLLHSRTFARRLAQKGSHPEEALCLRLLGYEEGISQRRLAKLMGRSPQAISKMLQGLESAGYLERRTDEQDRRVTRVYLKPSGKARDTELATVYTDFLNQTIGALPEADQLELNRLLSLFVSCLGKVSAETDSNEEEVSQLGGWEPA